MLKYKTKGAYWTPEPLDYIGSIVSSQPPAFHKDLSNPISIRAAVANMVHGCDIEQYIRMCTNPFDFMCSVKVRRGDTLLYRGIKQQRVTRYYVSTNGSELMKLAPSLGVEGAYKKANGVSDAEYQRVMAETGGQWDVRVCTKNKSKYEQRSGAICAGYKVSICNDAKDFDFSMIDYSWYVHEATKLVI